MLTRALIALYGLVFVVDAFLPTSMVSESVWATLFVGTVAWEMVGVFAEKRWRQEPLTRIYRDRLMRRGALGIPGYLYRVAYLFLFAWWMMHWLVPGW